MRILLILFIQLIVFMARAQDTIVVQDLRHAWVSMDKQGELMTYMPDTKTKVVFFQLPEDLQVGYYLKLQGLRPLDVWMNNQLILHQLDSAVFFTKLLATDHFKIYSESGISDALVTQILKIRPTGQAVDETISEKKSQWKDEYYLILLTVMLLLAGIYRRFFPVTFNQSVRNPLSYKIRSISADQTYVNFGSVDNLFSIFYFSALITFLFTILGYDLLFNKSEAFVYGLVNWLMTSLLISLIILIKFLWTKMIASLYQIRELPNIQTQDFVHFFTLIATGGLLISLIDFAVYDSSAGFLKDFIRYLAVASLLFFQFWLFFKFDKFSSFRKLMIISYLCTTEFLPGFLVIYWLTKM